MARMLKSVWAISFGGNDNMRCFHTAVLIWLMLVPPALAGMKEAELAYRQGDYATALRELRPLAEQGNVGAQLFLATMYEDGKGVPQDHVQAYKWYALTVVRGDQTFAIFRIRIAAQMTPPQIAEAQKLVREWLAANKDRPGG